MGNLYLVRHGQASFGAADYDNLSELGRRQSTRLGEHFREHGQRFDMVLTGTLKRHRQTFAGIVEGMQLGTVEQQQLPELNEFDAEALIRAIHPDPLAVPTTPDGVRAHFRLLREAITAWVRGDTVPEGMSSYDVFRSGVQHALDLVRAEYADADVLLVSSGGPISTAVGLVLGTAPETAIDLNLRMRNSALTEFAVTPRRHTLVTYNTLPHLHAPDYRSWITHA